MTFCGQGAYHVLGQARSRCAYVRPGKPGQRFDLKLAKLKNETLCWMLVQTLTMIGAMAAIVKLFGC